MVRETVRILRQKMTVRWSGKSTSRTVVRIWLLCATICLLVVNCRLSYEDDLYLRGEVTGDLDADGTITMMVVSKNASALKNVFISNWEDPTVSICRILITLASQTNITVFEEDYSNDTRTCTTLELPIGVLEVELEGGGFGGDLLDANITMVISEFRGEADGASSFLDDPSYETTFIISRAIGNATIPPNGEFYVHSARLRYNGHIVNMTSGGLIFPDNVTATLLLDCAGRLHSSGAMLGDNMFDVHLDGKVTIHDFHEKDKHGNWGHLHERLTIRGDDIEIISLDQPDSWSHWYENLEPWTIEIRSQNAVSYSSINPTPIFIEGALLWTLTFLGVHAYKRRQRLKTARPSGSGGILYTIQPSIPIGQPASDLMVPALPPKDGWRAKAAVLGGALCIINGTLVIILSFYYQSIEGFTTVCMIFGFINPLFAIIGGVFATLRNRYSLAILGALFTMVSPGFSVAGPVCMPIPFVGIVALGLIIAGRKSFNAASDQPVQSTNQKMIL